MGRATARSVFLTGLAALLLASPSGARATAHHPPSSHNHTVERVFGPFQPGILIVFVEAILAEAENPPDRADPGGNPYRKPRPSPDREIPALLPGQLWG